jgi:catechol 2,3-dioxygenase-like lactoylglutathione lyase family enzyme
MLDDDNSACRLTHVGITVPDLEFALSWYSQVLGLRVFTEPTLVTAGVEHSGRLAADVFGEPFGREREARLIDPNGVVLELFQFLDPKTPDERNRVTYWQTGPFHVCVVSKDIDASVKRIAVNGGRQRSSIWPTSPGSIHRMCYCEDPFGNIVELYSATDKDVHGTRATSPRDEH